MKVSTDPVMVYVYVPEGPLPDVTVMVMVFPLVVYVPLPEFEGIGSVNVHVVAVMVNVPQPVVQTSVPLLPGSVHPVRLWLVNFQVPTRDEDGDGSSFLHAPARIVRSSIIEKIRMWVFMLLGFGETTPAWFGFPFSKSLWLIQFLWQVLLSRIFVGPLPGNFWMSGPEVFALCFTAERHCSGFA